MAEYDFNRIMTGTAADSFSCERFFRELGLAAFVRKALGILAPIPPVCTVACPSVLQASPSGVNLQ